MTTRRRSSRFERIDRRVTLWMGRYGHFIERVSLALLFFWFGAMKLAGYPSATSIIAKTVYLGRPEITVPLLGLWEVMIGACFLIRRLNRIAILLLLVRVPGTLLALVLRFDECFDDSILVPTIQGQYLLKDLALMGAALVIGATVRLERREGHWL